MQQVAAQESSRPPVAHLLVGMWLAWSTTLIAIKVGLRSADPLSFSLLRVALTTVVLGVFILVVRHPPGDMSTPTVRRHGLLAALGLTGVGGFMLLQTIGLRDAPVGVASVVLFSAPLAVAIGSRVLLGEVLTRRKVFGLMIGWIGVAVVVGVEVSAIGTSPLALLILFGATLSWAANTLLYKAVDGLPSVVHVLFWSHVYSVLLLGLIVGFSGWRFAFDATSSFAVVWAALAGGIGGMGLMFWVLQRRPAGETSSYTFAVPVLAASFGIALLGEPLHVGLVVGPVAVGVSVWLIGRDREVGGRPVVAVTP